MKNLPLLLVVFFTLLSCNMQKEVDLKLPAYKNEMVIECYLAPGRTFKLSILESVSYFDSPFPPTVDSAFVTITYNGIKDTLKFDPQYDPDDQKLYNYVSTKIVPEDFDAVFELYVRDKKGREATAQTKILPKVLIDSVYVKYSEKDSMAAPVTVFHDNPTTTDFYRYVVQKEDKKTVVDYQADDLNLQSPKVELSSDFNIDRGTTVKISLYPVTKDFYDFYQSTVDARNANGNPFGQPSLIKSNIKGAIGIFTGLNGDSTTFYIPK